MIREIKVTLIENMLLEREEGQTLREDQKGGPANARMNRRQFKETAELVLAIDKEEQAESGKKPQEGEDGGER